MAWTIDAPLDELPDLPPLPADMAEKLEDALSRDAKQQPSWDPEHAGRVRKILESVPPIVVAPEVKKLKKQLAMFSGIFNLLWVVCAILMYV